MIVVDKAIPVCFTKANISTKNPQTTNRVLEQLLEKGSVKPTEDGFRVKVKMVGESSRDLNRTLLSALRKVEKKTQLRVDWEFGRASSGSLAMYPRDRKKG